MYEFIKGVPKISIQLEPGIYIFQCSSAAGKTYLAKQLKLLRQAGEKVDSFTWYDTKRGGLAQTLTMSDFPMEDLKVLLLDRYDRYSGSFVDEIQKLSKTCIVLIDCKGSVKFSGAKTCSIRLSGARIEVHRNGACL